MYTRYLVSTVLLAAAARAAAIPAAPDPKSPLDTAKVLMGEGKFDQALKRVDSYKAKGEAEGRRLFVKARILARQGDRDAARARLKELFTGLPKGAVASDAALALVDAIEGEKDFAALRDDLDFETVRATALGALRNILRHELQKAGKSAIGEHELYRRAYVPPKGERSVCVGNPLDPAGAGSGRCAPEQCTFGLVVVKRVKAVDAGERCFGVPVEI